MSQQNKQKVQLVLSSGGARGLAHIGVIEGLEAAGFQITEIVGCSMGAVVGGIYSMGKLPQYREWLLSLKRKDVFGLMDFTITKHGFLKGEKIFATILEKFGGGRIEDLPIPFSAVATDADNGEEVVFSEGDLYEALRASISIPGIFTPVHHQDRTLVDGGVVNPLPLNLIEKKEDHLLVAVDINAPLPLSLFEEKAPEDNPKSSWLSLNWPFFNSAEKNHRTMSNLIDVLQHSYDHMQNKLIALSVDRYQPDLLVNIPRACGGMFDFHRAAEIISIGEQAYHQAKENSSSKWL